MTKSSHLNHSGNIWRSDSFQTLQPAAENRRHSSSCADLETLRSSGTGSAGTWALGTHLSQGGLQLLKVSWEVCFCRQVLYGQEGGQRLDQISCQVNVVGPQSDLRVTSDAFIPPPPRGGCPHVHEQQSQHGRKHTTDVVPVRWRPC